METGGREKEQKSVVDFLSVGSNRSEGNYQGVLIDL